MSKLLTILLSIIGLVGAVGFYRLPPGWVEPSFQAALVDNLGDVKVTIPQAQIGWGGWRHPLGIKVRQVALRKEDRDLALNIPNLLFSLKLLPLLIGKAEIGRISFDSAKFYSKSQLIGVVSAKVKMRGKSLSLHADFQQVNVTALTHFIMGQNVSTKASFPIQGKLHLEGSRVLGFSTIDLQCKSEGGTLVIPEIYPEPLKLDKAHLVLKGTEQTLSLKKLSLQRGEAHLVIQGSLGSPVSWKHLYEQGGKLDLSLEGKGGAIPIDDLKLLWPLGLSSKPRHWVVHQLSKGKAGYVTTLMQGLIYVDPGAKLKSFEVPSIQGQIDASDVTVKYFGKLPPVTEVSGNCRFTREQFIIDAVGTANGIQLQRGKIVINDLHLDDQKIDIALDLEGPVRNSLEIINAEPLYLAKKLDLEPAHITGQATTQVHLSFPLETDVPLELVNVTAKSQIKEGKILYNAQMNGKTVTLDRGTFDLGVNKQSLEMKGDAYLQDVKTQIQWQEYFEDKDIPFRRQFILEGLLDLKKLKNFGINASEYLDGEAPTNLQYTVDEDGQGVLEGFLDLTSAIMVSPALPWQKAKGEPAHLKISLHKDASHETYHLDHASLIAPKLIMTMKENNLGQYFEIDQLKIGNTHLKSTIQCDKEGIYQASIQGGVLDLTHILDDSAPEPLLKPTLSKNDAGDAQIKVKLLLDEVRLGKNNPIHQVQGEMLYRGSTLMCANLKGKAPHNNEAISLSMTPVSKDQQQFTLESGDGGHLLEMLGADYDLEGGHLLIKGVKTEKFSEEEKEGYKDAQKSWEISGNITMDNFTINKAPLLARLLSAASLQGIVNFFSGRGIHFHEGAADFSLTSGSLVLNKVRLISLSLGLLLKGSIDRLKHQVNFAGELIPLYAINTVLAQIPLLGTWISGGREEGVFMTQFTLNGDRQDPVLTINPITSVTPGLVREFLKAQEVKPTTNP